nr:hypothetical protein [Mycobacterium paraffinicum]
MSFGDEFVGQALANDIQLFRDDRLDRRVVGQRAAVDRDCFKRMIGEISDVCLESAGKLFCQRHLRIGIGAPRQPVTSSFEYRRVQAPFTGKVVIQQGSRHASSGGDVLDEDVFIRPFREHRGRCVKQLVTPLLGR